MQNQYRYKLMEILKTTGEKMNARDFLQYFPGLIRDIGSEAQAVSALSSALSDMFMDGLIFRNHRKCTHGNMSKFNYFANAEPEIKANPAADITSHAENRDRAEIESLRCEVDRLRKQCEQHQQERMNFGRHVVRGYNVFAVRDGQFIDDIYSLDEAVLEAKRRAELNELDYVVVETAASATFSKTVTVEVIGK